MADHIRPTDAAPGPASRVDEIRVDEVRLDEILSDGVRPDPIPSAVWPYAEVCP